VIALRLVRMPLFCVPRWYVSENTAGCHFNIRIKYKGGGPDTNQNLISSETFVVENNPRIFFDMYMSQVPFILYDLGNLAYRTIRDVTRGG
jgi:hypothetical protein